MSPFFRPYESYDDVTLHDVRPPFHPLTYPTDEEFDSDTHLTLTYSVESNPSESTYSSMIRLTSDSSSSSAASCAPPSVRGCGFIRTHAILMGVGVPVVEDEGMTHLEAVGTYLFRFEVEDGVESTC